MTAYDRIAEMPEFRALLKAKRRFIVRACVFFVLYYFTLPVLVGTYPFVVDRPLIGAVNFAYLFALSQFVMAWLIAWLYVRRAAHFDAMAQQILDREQRGQ